MPSVKFMLSQSEMLETPPIADKPHEQCSGQSITVALSVEQHMEQSHRGAGERYHHSLLHCVQKSQ